MKCFFYAFAACIHAFIAACIHGHGEGVGREATEATAPSYTITYPRAHVERVMVYPMYHTPIIPSLSPQYDLCSNRCTWKRVSVIRSDGIARVCCMTHPQCAVRWIVDQHVADTTCVQGSSLFSYAISLPRGQIYEGQRMILSSL